MPRCAPSATTSVIRYQDGKYERVGEPTEAALKVLVEKIGVTEQPRSSDPAFACSQANAQWSAQNPCQAILEFSRDRKSMSTLCGAASADAAASATGTPGRTLRSGKTAAAGGSGKNQLYCKGAPESVLERCAYARLADGSTVSMSAADRKAILAKVSEMAARPLRTPGHGRQGGRGRARRLRRAVAPGAQEARRREQVRGHREGHGLRRPVRHQGPRAARGQAGHRVVPRRRASASS